MGRIFSSAPSTPLSSMGEYKRKDILVSKPISFVVVAITNDDSVSDFNPIVCLNPNYDEVILK